VEETQIAARWACFDVAPMFPDGALGSNTPPTDAFFSVQHCMGVGLPVGAGGVECDPVWGEWGLPAHVVGMRRRIHLRSVSLSVCLSMCGQTSGLGCDVMLCSAAKPRDCDA
jgi:hypothetical protein